MSEYNMVESESESKNQANPDVLGVAVASSCQLATTLPGQNASNAPSAGFAAKSL